MGVTRKRASKVVRVVGGSRLAKMADEEEELGTSEHEVEHPPMAGGAGEKGDDEGSRVRRSLMLGSTVCR